MRHAAILAFLLFCFTLVDQFAFGGSFTRSVVFEAKQTGSAVTNQAHSWAGQFAR